MISTLFIASLLASKTTAFITPRQHSPSSLQRTDQIQKEIITRATFSSSRLNAAVVDEQVTSTTEAQSDSQNIFGVVSDAVTGLLFSLLHAFDDCGIEDSSKNLRVLWVRALLNYRGQIKDDIAETFLPPTTRGLVTSDGGAALLNPILKFAEWIQARTEFIDESLDSFLSSPVCTDAGTGKALECNVVLFGAGYDTRALRYRHEHEGKINFIEVDLPSVVEGKSKLYEKFQREQDKDWDLEGRGSKLVPFDLNNCGGSSPVSLIDTLRDQGELKENIPTFLVWEAVLFYVNEDAVRNIMSELFAFAKKGGNGDGSRAETLLCFTGKSQAISNKVDVYIYIYIFFYMFYITCPHVFDFFKRFIKTICRRTVYKRGKNFFL